MKTLFITTLLISLATLLTDRKVEEPVAPSNNLDAVKALPMMVSPGNVVAIRPITLKSEISIEEFERFVTEDFTPIFEEQVPGVRAYILKGERGDEKGEYSFALIFDSVNTRDYYYPFEHGGEASVPDNAMELWMPAHKAIFEDLMQYVTGYGEEKNYTDYVVLGNR